MTKRNFPLPQGDIGWLFPKLTDAAEQDAILRTVQTADDVVHRVGERLGLRPDAQFMGVPLNSFVYTRLGPEAEFPVTILAYEGWSDQICASVTLAPTGRNPYTRPGPPWEVEAEIQVRCDSDPDNCRWHPVDLQTVQPIATPMEAARELLTASEWLLQRIEEETEQSLRARDLMGGHAPEPHRVD